MLLQSFDNGGSVCRSAVILLVAAVVDGAALFRMSIDPAGFAVGAVVLASKVLLFLVSLAV